MTSPSREQPHARERDPSRVADELLVLRAQSGDRDAFGALYTRLAPRLLRHARRLTDSHDEARDVAQEVWVAIAGGIGSLRDPASFHAWALRMTGHKAADLVRTRTRDRNASAELSINHRTPESPADDADDLREHIRRLPEGERLVLTLHHLEGLGIREIARALGAPEGTIKSRLYSARTRLRGALEARHEQHR